MKNIFYSFLVVPIGFISFVITVYIINSIVPNEAMFFGYYYKVIYTWPVVMFLVMYSVSFLLKTNMKLPKSIVIAPLPAIVVHFLTHSVLGSPVGIVIVCVAVIALIWIVCESIDHYTKRSNSPR